MPKAVVVDTNVINVSNNRAPQASPECVLACVSALESVIGGDIISIDDGGEILSEYGAQGLSFSGQPGVGDYFFKWLFDHQWNEQHCERVIVHRTSGPNGELDEFPKAPNLAGFDPSDRIFVAVALTSTLSPEILNAVDSDWWNFREALAQHGVRINFLCPEAFQE
jgi:hypothetical protein